MGSFSFHTFNFTQVYSIQYLILRYINDTQKQYTHSFILLTFNVITVHNGDDDGWIPTSILYKSVILLRINHEPFIYFPHIYRFVKIEKKQQQQNLSVTSTLAAL